MKTTIAVLLILISTSCRRTFEAPVPNTFWDLFNSANAVKLTPSTRMKLEGVYSVDAGADVFGSLTAAKWSYTAAGTDTTYHLSFFCEKDAAFIICEGKRLDSSILLNGFWRKMINTETGKVRLTIPSASGSKYLLDGSAVIPSPSLVINGVFGNGEAAPEFPLKLIYQRTLNPGSFEIVAHRGGGRTADLLPASENTVEMMRLAARLGATGIETDVRLTKDGVPILYHDATLNERLVQKDGLLGPIENYTYAQLNTLVRLKNGERIPTLREALNTVVYETPLRFVWLDTKFHGSLSQIRAIQQEFVAKAAAIGRSVDIRIGIPDQDVFKEFLLLPDYKNVPSVSELNPPDVALSDSKVWGPQWTQGLMQTEVQQAHAAGRKVYVWTLDISENIQEYMTKGNFDGILSNYPTLVAYHHYVR